MRVGQPTCWSRDGLRRIWIEQQPHKHIFRLPALPAALLVWALYSPARACRLRASRKPIFGRAPSQGLRGRSQSDTWIQPDAFRSFHLQHAQLRPLLGRAPKEASQALASSGTVISLPMPDGTQARFRFVESPVMHPDLAARFPEIKTYRGQGIDDPAATVRFDLTPVGFHAQILSPRGAVYIEPYLRGNTNLHAVYARRGYRPSAPDFECRTDGTTTTTAVSSATPQAATQVVSSGNLRTYRLACAATAEYTAYFGGNVSAGLAAIVTAINRVSGVYETELGIRLVLVANNDQIVYTNTSTEPYSNGNPTALLMQNQANLDAVIGSTNYDIGHVFSTAGGGLAGVGVACVAGIKAEGETGTYPPVGDAFYIDYVAHEIGHQFGATHSFNSSANACGYGNRCAATAYEPGSGSTIMSYAGICSADNLQVAQRRLLPLGQPGTDPQLHHRRRGQHPSRGQRHRQQRADRGCRTQLHHPDGHALHPHGDGQRPRWRRADLLLGRARPRPLDHPEHAGQRQQPACSARSIPRPARRGPSRSCPTS